MNVAERPSNEQVYQDQAVVRTYAERGELQPAERSVLERLRPRLATMSMLDVGVGGGRTTVSFAPLVARYVGVDYSQAMVDACRRRFGDLDASTTFEVADARAMSSFEDGSFDLVLFSFNGLDSVGHADRGVVLSEIGRVLRPGGTFCFSSHNLSSADRLLSVPWHLGRRPGAFVRRLVRLPVLRLLNESPTKMREQPWAMITDGAFSFRLRHYYIRPSEQLDQLQRYGFDDVSVFRRDGEPIEAGRNVDSVQDDWLYYLCSRSA